MTRAERLADRDARRREAWDEARRRIAAARQRNEATTKEKSA